MLLHEQYHIRHHDLWVRLLACALQAVYWYNPLIWVGIRCMERDMEMRCDEYVLEQLGRIFGTTTVCRCCPMPRAGAAGPWM